MTDLSIEHLEIENFRGIPGVLSLDLSAPLTVIYAANGSGKSSVCQAIEWLLTGKVEAVPATSLACLWGQGVTSVKAVCRMADQRIGLHRTLSGLVMHTSGAPQVLSDIDLLIKITPEEIGPEGRSNTRQNLKTEWLRSSRWLYSSALSLLVDNEHAALRKQIFANILGYGHLIPVLNKLSAYVDAIPSDRSLLTKRRQIEEEIRQLAEQVDQEAHAQARITQNLDEYARLTGYVPGSEASYEQVCDDAAMHAAQQEQALDLRQQHLNNVQAGEDTLLNSAQTEVLLKDSNGAIEKQLDLLREELRLLNGQISAHRRSAKESRNRAERAEQSVASLQAWDGLRVRLSELCGVAPHLLTRRHVLDALPAVTRPENERNSLLKAWTTLWETRNRWDGFGETLADLRLKVSLSPTAEAVQGLEQEKNAARDNHTRQAGIFESMSSATEQLRALGLDLLHQSQDKTCPLCSEPQPDHQSLVSRIEQAQSAMSPVVAAALKASTDAAAEADRAELLWQTAQQSFQEAQIALRETENITRRVNQLINDSGIDEWETDLSPQTVARGLDDSLERAKLTVSAGTFFENAVGLTGEHADASKFIDEHISAERTVLTESARLEQQKHAEHIAAETEKNRKLTLLEASVASAVEEMENGQRTLTALIQKRAPLLDSWRFLCGNTAFTSEKLGDLKRTQANALDTLHLAKHCLEQAKAALTSSQAYAKLSILQQASVRLNEQITLRQRRLDAGNSTLNAWGQHVNTVSQNSLKRLLTPASELFSKMHANEVYQSLSLGQEQGDFCWKAIADELSSDVKTIDAESHFSQGQRQDLALSLFLARARSLKGSFFLDEPVAHLDDLNRVAMMDIFRMLSTSESSMRLILTTASNGLRRHLRQKFSAGECHHQLKIVTLEGNPKQGVTVTYS
ncbi:AAA family ATPase [Duffyella gerundensis]|uniref:AAA family ATPase n=1 Tax=Duffyella gerundensis TaxID=1619313 RepID=UPI001AEAF957|nr:AAA family ATPase [Duffyella gerundensis]QTO52777.1 AAA family ATPase [Duffyella gerundensis]